MATGWRRSRVLAADASARKNTTWGPAPVSPFTTRIPRSFSAAARSDAANRSSPLDGRAMEIPLATDTAAPSTLISRGWGMRRSAVWAEQGMTELTRSKANTNGDFIFLGMGVDRGAQKNMAARWRS